MKIFFSFILFFTSLSYVFGQKYLLDSSETHAYIKLTSYPFLLHKPESKNLEGNFALGPSLSLSGNKIELQIGILYDLMLYKGYYHPVHTSTTYFNYHRYFLPISIKYHINPSKKIQLYPSLGGGLIASPFEIDSRWWIFTGAGIAYKIDDKIKISISVLGQKIELDGLSPAAFFELAYRLN